METVCSDQGPKREARGDEFWGIKGKEKRSSSLGLPTSPNWLTFEPGGECLVAAGQNAKRRPVTPAMQVRGH